MKKARMFICVKCNRPAPSGVCEICGQRAMLKEQGVEIYTPKGLVHGPDCRCLVCPKCGATEVDDCRKPSAEWTWNIRPFAKDNLSHCLKCDSWFDVETEERTKGMIM